MKGKEGFQKGEVNNPQGRPRKPEIELVRQAIAETDREKKKTLWKHLIEQCYEDNTVLVAVAKKFLPDLTEDNGTKEFLIELVKYGQSKNP